MKKKIRGFVLAIFGIVAATVLICVIINAIVIVYGNSRILNLEYSDGEIVAGLPSKTPDCILILGAGLQNGRPGPMLSERLDLGAALYHAGASDRILVSGDDSGINYNEIKAMTDYLVDNCDIPLEAIIEDHEGFSTFESMYRARTAFNIDSAVIVTQKYHLFRATYIASKLGIEAYGADAHRTSYFGREYRELRECAARVKDFFLSLIVKGVTSGT